MENQENDDQLTIEELILLELEELKGIIPITCDRVIPHEDSINIYGWIENKKGKKRDFILFMFDKDIENGTGERYFTSSAKYSKRIGEILKFKPQDHVPCVKFNEFFKDKLKLIDHGKSI